MNFFVSRGKGEKTVRGKKPNWCEPLVKLKVKFPVLTKAFINGAYSAMNHREVPLPTFYGNFLFFYC